MTRPTLAPAERLRRLLRRVRRRGLRVLVLGIGNEMLGDDAVGHLLACDLADLVREGFLATGCGVAVENAGPLIRRHRADVVVLIDAATGIRRLPWGFVPIARLDAFCHSTHSVPLSLLVSVWKADNPTLDVHFIGVTPRSNEFGSGLSPAVAAARTEIAAIFREVLAPPE
jgi:hydrogenase 3 maturation protease